MRKNLIDHQLLTRYNINMRLEYEHILKKNNSSFYASTFVGESFECPYHIHEEFEIVLISKGRGRIVVGDYSSRYEPQSLYFFGSNLPHTFFSDSLLQGEEQISESHYAQFKQNCLGTEFFNLKELKQFNKLLKDSERGLQFKNFDYNKIESLFSKLNDENSLIKLSAFIEILANLAITPGYESLATEHYTRVNSHYESDRLNRSIDTIHRNFAQQISLEEVASVANLSPAAFSRFFKNHMNQSFIDYLIELRLSEASRLLLETDLPITDISLDVGFKNLSNFNRQFLKRKNISPRKFRNGGV